MSKSFGAASTTDEVLDGVKPERQARAGDRGVGRPWRRDGPGARGAWRRGRGRRARSDQGESSDRAGARRRRERRQPRAGRARSCVACERAGLRRRACRERQAVRSRHLQCGRDGDAIRQDGGRVRDAIRDQPSRPFRAGQPDRIADEAGLAAGQSVVSRPSDFRRRSRRSEFRAHALQRMGVLRPFEDRQHPVRGRVRPPSQGSRNPRRRPPSRRHSRPSSAVTWTTRRNGS